MKKPTQSVRRKKAVAKAEPSPASGAGRSRGGSRFPIVGIGASAGGLEALEQFLRHTPADCGLAFVVVQHLDPVHKGIMPELLQRATTMTVRQVKDRTRVQPGCVYVIPPNKDLSLLHGVLHLLDPSAPRGLRLPIDFFFRSLAADCRERSVGIILSGMGTDGTIGIRAIKEHSGVVLVQEPGSAKFDGMPRAAIEAGLMDIVAPPEALPARLLEYLHHTPLLGAPAPEVASGTQSGLEKVVILLRDHTGHDFALYKPNTLNRRIERRMGLHQITRMGMYVRYLRGHPQEVDLLFKELLIGVTGFFRDPAAWDRLREEGLPPLLAARSSGQTLRAWVPGCSTGEEAYSLAIVFKEALEQGVPARAGLGLQIFATDLDREVVEKARQGLFPANIAADVSPERLGRFFTEEERGYRVSKAIREMVVFAPQNLIMDPPFTKLDLLSCRNLLIYLTAELQRKIIPLFHYSLNPGGLLFLGSAETIGGFTGLFEPIGGKSRLYRSLPSSSALELADFPAAFAAHPPDRSTPRRTPSAAAHNLESLAERWLLAHHAPAAVLINDQGDILFVSGRTGRYLEPAAGKANWNVFVMAREELRYELAGALQTARRQSGAVTRRHLKVGVNGGTQLVDLIVHGVEEPATLRGLFMIVFREVTAAGPERKARAARPGRAGDRERDLEQALQRAQEELRGTREEMQTSQEELKSMNEELQSTNEELQSTNEELTTSKEEMQSLNEELQTVNAELQAKVEELSATGSDLKNLLNSTGVATVFLDSELRVRRFTDTATRIIKLIPGDVGRPFADLASDLIESRLGDRATEVLQTLVPQERTVATRDGRWFAMRLMPYRTLDNRIDGVVITFADVSEAKELEARLRERLGTSEGSHE